jgi:hypothetical protein
MNATNSGEATTFTPETSSFATNHSSQFLSHAISLLEIFVSILPDHLLRVQGLVDLRLPPTAATWS